MNARSSWGHRLAALLLVASVAHSANAAPNNSALTNRLFLQILAAEMYVNASEDAKGFQLMLDAARQQRDEDLYRRAIQIALQNGAGGSALTAARTWRADFPASSNAIRFELQILLALNRIGETGPVIKSIVQALKGADQVDAINSIPSTYANTKDSKEALLTVRAALSGVKWTKPAGVAVHTSLGRMALAAGEPKTALQEAQLGHGLDPTSDWPVLLALGLMERGQTDAEALVLSHAKATRNNAQQAHKVALAYAQVLVNLDRRADGLRELQQVQQRWPNVPEAWLLMGSLQAESDQDEAAIKTLQRYLELSNSTDQAAGRTQALIQLAGLAEKKGDMVGATAWLDLIAPDQDQLSAHIRRASVLRQQGRIEQARQTLRDAPERRPTDARLKLLAEIELLRDAQDHLSAYELYTQAVARFPQDPDLVYEQATLAEKLQRWDDMERLLRGLMQSHPSYQHAYNALGYSWANRNVRLTEAKALIEKAVALAPTDGYILDSLGWVEFRLGNHAVALEHLRRAYELKADAEIAAHWGEVLWVSGQPDAAMGIWRKGLAINADNSTLLETLKRFNVQP